MNPFILLSISITAEVCGTTAMKLSHGFSDPLFTAATIAAYVVAFSIFTIVLKKLPLGLAYGIWGGVGLSHIHISEPTRLQSIAYAVMCL